MVTSPPSPSTHVKVTVVGVAFGQPKDPLAVSRYGALQRSEPERLHLQLPSETMLGIRETPGLLRYVEAEDKFLGEEELAVHAANTAVAPRLEGFSGAAQKDLKTQ
jgi:hypothetical protein